MFFIVNIGLGLMSLHFSTLFFRHVFPFQKFRILNHGAVHLPAWDSFMLAGPGFDFGPFVLFAFDSCLLIVHVPLARNLVEMVSISFHLYTFLNSVFPRPKSNISGNRLCLLCFIQFFFSSYIFFFYYWLHLLLACVCLCFILIFSAQIVFVVSISVGVGATHLLPIVYTEPLPLFLTPLFQFAILASFSALVWWVCFVS